MEVFFSHVKSWYSGWMRCLKIASAMQNFTLALTIVIARCSLQGS